MIRGDRRKAKDEDLERKEKERNVTLGTWVGYGALGLMAIQVLVANYVFIKYAHESGWKIPVGAMQAWLAAVVVQVIGVVLVITKSLFPSDSDQP